MRKNILIIAHSHESQFVDIYNQYTRAFDKAKYLVTVLYLTISEREELREKTLAEQVLFANINKRKLRFLKFGAIQFLISLCRQHHYDVVICHRYKPSYLMMLASKFCSIPKIIFVMHAIGTMRSKRRQWFIAAVQKSNMLFAGVSNAVRDDLRAHLTFIPKERIVTLYNAIDVELTAPRLLTREQARAELGIANDTFAFGHVGRFEANKDQRNLLQAFSLIAAECPQAKLIMVGSGVKEDALKKQAASYLLTDLIPRTSREMTECAVSIDEDEAPMMGCRSTSDRIVFTGHIPYAFRYMSAFDCFVLSSSQEAFGRVLLEAMIAKVPVIGTDAYGIPEVIGDAGKIVPAKDAEKLGAAMREIYLLPMSEKEKLGESAHQQMLRHFSLPVFFKQLNEHLGLESAD